MIALRAANRLWYWRREKMVRKIEQNVIQQNEVYQIMQIWLEGNIEAHDFGPKDYWISNYPMVQKQILHADIYVYETDGKIQGFVGMIDNYLAGIFVDRNCRSFGIGHQLLNHVKSIHPVLELHVYQKNRRAVEFYLGEGFSVTSESVDGETGELEYTMSWG